MKPASTERERASSRERYNAPKIFRLIAVGFAFVGVWMSVGGWFTYRRTTDFLGKAALTTGIIVGNHRRTDSNGEAAYYPVVRRTMPGHRRPSPVVDWRSFDVKPLVEVAIDDCGIEVDAVISQNTMHPVQSPAVKEVTSDATDQHLGSC